LKIWGYQEDTVRVLKLRIGAFRDFGYGTLEGKNLPVVEFRKAVRDLAKRGRKTPIVFEYKGKIYASDDITKDPNWSPWRLDWEMFLLDFREIQPTGANKCRW
jgi:hypothetical protein